MFRLTVFSSILSTFPQVMACWLIQYWADRTEVPLSLSVWIDCFYFFVSPNSGFDQEWYTGYDLFLLVDVYAKLCVCVHMHASVGGCYSSHHLDNYGSFYRWALKGESVIINMSHWYLRKACNTHTHTHACTITQAPIHTQNQSCMQETWII